MHVIKKSNITHHESKNTNIEQSADNQATELSLPTKLVFIGYYHEPILHRKLHTHVKHEDAFLLDNSLNPQRAVRLTGNNPSYTPFPLHKWKADFNKPGDFLYHDDNEITYYIDISQDNQPWINHGAEITLQSIIDAINTINQNNYKQSLKTTPKLRIFECESAK